MRTMNRQGSKLGLGEVRDAWRANRWLLRAAALFSVFVNLLMLTGPLFMLQVYDRVLVSRSEQTLLALFILMTFMFAMMGLLDFVRGRILARIGARFQAGLDRRVFAAVLLQAARAPHSHKVANNLRDLEAVQRLVSSPVFTAVFDMPWTPVFLAAILIFHPWLGALALTGGGVLIALTSLQQWRTRLPAERAAIATITSENLAEHLRTEAEMLRALGMQDSAFERWNLARRDALRETMRTADHTGGFTALSRSFRLFLQSAMLGLGAYLVLQSQLSPGAMIAASVLLGRALAPVDLAIGQWHLIQRAHSGWHALGNLLSEVPPLTARTKLPRPKAHLHAENVTIIAPGQNHAALRMVSFDLQPGQALGVIGPSGAGKSTLARAITGVWPCAGGHIRLDGASLDQFDPDVLGQHVGYLPQRVRLFDGTIGENIARLALLRDDEKVVIAAKKAAAHEMILCLPRGYDTLITGNGAMLSGGQIQRIGLARAMYGDPVVLVLDEPNSNLDNDGSLALNAAIREMKKAGGAVLIMAHRPAAIQECEKLLFLDAGTARAYGPRDAVLRDTVKNLREVGQDNTRRGVS